MQPVRRCCQTIKHIQVICQCLKMLNFLPSTSCLRLLAHTHILQSHLSLQHSFLFFPSIHLKNPPGFQDVFQLSLSFLREAGFVHIHFLEGLG